MGNILKSFIWQLKKLMNPGTVTLLRMKDYFWGVLAGAYKSHGVQQTFQKEGEREGGCSRRRT
jgi:hypothetical protein